MTTEETGFPADTPDTPKKGQGRRRMTWKKWLAIGLAAVVVLGGVGVGAFLLLRPTNTNRGSISRDYQATLGTQTQTVSFDGTLSPAKQSNVNFAVAGTVTKVKVKAGDTVTKGQTLAKIDSSDLADAVDLAEANLTTAKANLAEVYDNDGSSAAITSAKAQVTSARAALTSAKTSLEDAVLTSPVSGTVASVGIEVGDSVSASSGSSSSSSASSSSSSSSSTSSSAAIVVIGTSTWKVEGSVGASSLSSLKAGQSVSVTTDSSTDAIKGTVSSVGIVATSTDSDGAATFPVVVKLSGKHTGLYSGTTATAVITTGTYTDVLTVPTAAITTTNGQTVVKKVTNNTATETSVEVGKVFGSYTQIKSGLAEGDTVRVTVTFASSTSSSSSQGGSLFGGGGGGDLGGLSGGGGGGQPPAGGGNAGGNR
jgi:multidrug efflux pump subunit AcrA (membrane-fusion protein)